MSARFDYNLSLFVFIIFCGFCTALIKGETCIFQDGSKGKCKLMRECPIAQRLIKTGVFPVICGLEGTTSIICCKDDEEMTKVINITSATYSVNSRTPGDIIKEKCKKYAEYAYEKIPSPTLLLNPHITKKFECDIPRNRLIIGGSLTGRKEFPHMALISFKNDDEFNWSCAGSLISENFVLTVAHCLYSPKRSPALLVRVGFTNKLDPTHMQERTVSEIIPYPEFDTSNGFYHDIGLLRLSKNVEFNAYARPACLYTENIIPSVPAIISGWGDLSLSTNLSNDLLATVLEFYSVDTCNKSAISNFGNELLKDGIIDDLMICAGIFVSSKGGQSGSPLQIYRKETEDAKCMYDIIGVMSFAGYGIEVKNPFYVFTRVSTYIKWIEYVVWPN